MRAKQLSFAIKGPRRGTKADLVSRHLVFGGAISYRKAARPFRRGRATHLVFRSRWLQGPRSLLRQTRQQWASGLIHEKARRHHARLYRFSVNSNHLHLLLRFPSAKAQSQFLRDFAGSFARRMKQSFQMSKAQRFWDSRPFSRVVRAKSFKSALEYVDRNCGEAAGELVYRPRSVSKIFRVLSQLKMLSG